MGKPQAIATPQGQVWTYPATREGFLIGPKKALIVIDLYNGFEPMWHSSFFILSTVMWL
jgi:hypothetical protein